MPERKRKPPTVPAKCAKAPVKTKWRERDAFLSALDDAFHDPENCSIDPVVNVALSDDHHEYTRALHLLRNMSEFGRKEADIFLIGLLMTCGDDWKKRVAIAEMLYCVQTEACVDVLFSEVKRVKSTNLTRRYLREVIEVLSEMPPKLVRSRLETMAEDKSLTPWIRTRLQKALDDIDYRVRLGHY